MKDYYRILQITPHASQEEVKKAYRRLAKVHHPDLAGGSVREEVLILEINEAYRTLSNLEKRSRYDWIRTNKEEAVDNPEQPVRRNYQPVYKEAYDERALVKPYLPYTYTINKLALIFCLLLIVDFFLPLRHRTDKVTYIIEETTEQNGEEVAEHTQVQTWKGRRYIVSREAGLHFAQNPDMLVYSTPMFGKVRYIGPASREVNRFLIEYSIYGNFAFLPLILLLTAFLGSFKKFSPELSFSFGVVSGFMLLICAGLLLI